METISRYFTEFDQMMREISLPHLQRVLQLIEQVYYSGHRIFIVGNGGSAATASHFALDLAKNTILPGVARLILTHVITRHMREVVCSYAQRWELSNKLFQGRL